MLLVHPIKEVLRFLPVLIGLALAGTASDGSQPWHYLGVAVPIVLGVLRYLTTRFRISGGRVELRRGLLEKHVTSTPIDRVRTVDLTATPIHRVLGLTKVRIGTGLATSDDDSLELDGLPRARAEALRGDLLRLVAAESGPMDETEPRANPEQLVAAFDPAWVRFAPLSGAALVVAVAGIGGLAQVLNSIGFWEDLDPDEWNLPVASGLAIAGLGVVVLVAIAVVSALAYVITNGDYRLTRVAGAWHVRRGLLTTRETSLDEDRLAGVMLGEPLALRAARGRSLTAIVTGVSTSDRSSAMLVPPSDADITLRVAGVVLGTSAPVLDPLRSHGPAARRRRWSRALVPTLALAVVLVAVSFLDGVWWPTVLAVVMVFAMSVIAADRAAGLGSALIEQHVVARSGSLTRRREILAAEHVIGWTWRATWFQRRVGLTALTATTAAGGGAVTLLDVPVADSLQLAEAALPGLASQFISV